MDIAAERPRAVEKPGEAPQRLAVLASLPGLLAEYGVSLDHALEGLPIAVSQFDDPEARVPYWATGALLDRSAALTGCAHLGLLLGSRYDHTILGVVGEWLQTAPDLATALAGFTILQATASRGGVAYLQRMEDSVILGYGIYDRQAVAHDQIYPFATVVGFNLVRGLTRGAVRPLEVLLSIRPPVDPAPFSSVFGVPVRFDQPQTGLVFSRKALATPIGKPAGSDLANAQRRAFATMPPADAVWTDRVRRMLRVLLLSGEPLASVVAARLDVHQRTLARHLAAEGVSFQALLDDVRYAVARELLTVTDLPVGDIAFALAYATHGAFADAFRRWSGMSASAWRTAVRST